MTNLTSNFSYPWSYLQDYVILDSLIFPRFLLGVDWVPVNQGFVFIIAGLGRDAFALQRLKKFLWPGDSWSRLLRSVDRNRGGELSLSPGGTLRSRGTSPWTRTPTFLVSTCPRASLRPTCRESTILQSNFLPWISSGLPEESPNCSPWESVVSVSSILSPRRFLSWRFHEFKP